MNPNIDDEDFKKYFEANLLDGDDVYGCGKAMLSAEHVYEVLRGYLTNKIKEAELEAVYNVFYMVWIEDGAPLQRDDPPSEILRHIEKLESEATDV